MNAFSDIVIKRFNNNKDLRDQIKTRIVYAPKQRVLADLLDKDQNLQLPVVSVSIGGMARDDSRVFNKILGTYYTPTGKTNSVHERGVIPVNVSYNISILTRYQQDMDQILSHLLPYINPYFIVSWRTPSRPEHEIRSKVTWDGSVNIEYPQEQNASQVARVAANLSFVFQGWLFQTSQEIENIYTFNTTLINAGNASYEDLIATDKAQLTGLNTVIVDNFIYSAVPPRPKFVDPVYALTNVIQPFDVWGMGFDLITNAYLSGAPVAAFSSLQNPFSAVNELSAKYPAFTAYKLLSSDWSYNRFESSMRFHTPLMPTTGKIDLILENIKGYGKLTENVPVNNFNPYVQGSPSYNNWTYEQLPYLSGIEVF
jgi:hypothetical protein